MYRWTDFVLKTFTRINLNENKLVEYTESMILFKEMFTQS